MINDAQQNIPLQPVTVIINSLKQRIEAVSKPTDPTEVSLPSFCADALEALDSVDARSFVTARVAGAIIYIWRDNETSRLASSPREP